MPPVEQVAEQPAPKETAPTTKSVIGIIYPPPEIRNIIDKTGSFVARNGLEFENRIRQNEINNPKFNFLNPNDPYHAYYQHKVKEFKEGKGQEPAAPKPGGGLGLGLSSTKQQDVVKIIEPVVPKEPPPEPEFVADPPSISAFDLDVVKLTAQFVARNGRGFLTNLMNREQRNYQFDFLRPQHSLFNYFTKLVEQYTKILIPPKDLLPKLRKEADNTKVVLDQVKYRVDWAKFQEREKAKEEEAKEKERVAYAQIDWHDFVVVETVDFQPNETGNLPPPTTPDEVGARLLAQERFETDEPREEPESEMMEMDVESGGESGSEDEGERDKGKEKTRRKPGEGEHKKPTEKKGADTTLQDMEEGSDEEDSGGKESHPPKLPPPPPGPPPTKDDKGASKEQPPLPPVPPPPPKETMPQPPPLPPTPDQVIIKEYNPKASKVVESEAPDKFLISPITGEKIPADKIQEHLRIGLLDPKWIEQRDRAIQEKREQEDVFAAGASIDTTLKKLAERRTDIFGSGAQETQIGKKIGEEDQKKTDKIIWDGHTASMEKVSQKARENISIEDQIAVIHKVKGLVQDEEKEKIGPSVKVPITSKHGIPPLPPQPPMQMKPPPPKPVIPPPKPPSMPAPPQPPKMSVAPMRPPMAAPPQPPVVPMGGRPMQPPGMMVLPPRPPMAPGPRMVAMQMPPQPPQMMMGMGGPRGPPRPPMPPQTGPPVTRKQAAKGPGGDEPVAKKAKTEEDLMSEGEFLTKHPDGVSTFKVAVPSLPDKSDWKCTGQMVEFKLPLTDTVSVIKAKIHESISMPVGKQKLQFEGMFIKDSNTLAFYNIGKNAVIQLQLKERGGRKK